MEPQLYRNEFSGQFRGNNQWLGNKFETSGGDVNFNLSERPESPPNPSAVIPFSRDADFVERRAILDQINQNYKPASRTALVGLGGVGKSQLAIEFAYQTRERSPETWVFWVYASNADRFEQSYRDIADCVKISGRRNPRANIFKLVHDWLRDSKRQWMLILDNIDDARFLLDTQGNGQGQRTESETASKPLREYLPHCQSGSIFITTRSKEAALKLVEPRNTITIEPMNEEQALALFEKKLEVQEDGNDITELAAALEYMPLAIVQAAAYISQRVPRCSVRQYLEEFQKSDRKRASLLNRDGEQLRRDREAKNSIIITWQISFDYVHQTRPSAADLLSLMSFFDRQGIPDTLLRNRTEQGDAGKGQRERESDDRNNDEEDNISQSSASDDEFEDDVAALRNFSFISANADGTTFEMHGLVQLAMRKWLEANGKLEQWKEQFIGILYARFPTGRYENWARCQALFAHAKSAAAQQPEEGSSLAEWATVLYRAAWYAWEKGSVADAEILAVKSMKARRRVLGKEHEDTLSSMEMVGLAYKLGGRWEEAEKLFMQVLETSKTKLGADNPSTLSSMANLASTYWNQGRWEEAEQLEVEVMESHKTKLGADHPSTLTSMANLASTYRKKGRWEEAEQLDVQVMENRKTKLGADHPSTLSSMANLASTYWNQGRWEEAEELFVQVIETRKTKLGADHPDTLTSMANLASTYRKQGRWEEAEQLDVQVMENRKTKLGADNLSTLTSMANLASTYRKQGRWEEAEQLEVEVMESHKTKLGADHPSTLTSMNNLAITWKRLGRDTEAIQLMRDCVKRQTCILGATHPRSLSSKETLTEWEGERLDISNNVATRVDVT